MIKVEDILKESLELWNTYDWTQNVLARDRHGKQTTSTSGKVASVCAYGCLVMAAQNLSGTKDVEKLCMDIIDDAAGLLVEQAKIRWPERSIHDDIVSYNDMVAESKDEIVSLFTAVYEKVKAENGKAVND